MGLTVIGMDQIKKDLGRFPQDAPRVYGDAVVKAAARLRDETKAVSDFPVATGRMRQSINSRKLALMASGVFVGTDYGVYVHEGTSRMQGRPFFKWALEGGAQEAINKIFETAMKLLPPK